MIKVIKVIKPNVTKIEPLLGFTISYSYQVTPISEKYRIFVHVTRGLCSCFFCIKNGRPVGYTKVQCGVNKLLFTQFIHHVSGVINEYNIG